ncbi:MAG: toll/interleukin-1 receptor domain-containing protein [Anaerolineales bacterium]|nr:toll/interleukin-1 receptor domain-containing protein [Anaerolineales bacterium]
MGTVESVSYRYWAFISYSSKDKSWARWLHRAIETYGIPARLVHHPTPAGDPAPKRFWPLFHDRAELPASANLGAEIEDALRASRYLIVICSPHAARSMWVNQEVETFQRLDRSGRVLAVIVDGEPNAGDERECFPPALRTAEPAAADARPDRDGKGDAKLKLLAGMLGLGFDALKQRDTHRHIRRLQATITLVSVLAMGFAGLALYAQHQRDEAVKARQQAESMLEYLLFDLRNELKPLGRLDIVEDVQVQVDAYFRDLGVEQRDSSTLRNRSVAHWYKGDRLLAQGDLVGALREFQEALGILERLASSDPSDVIWQRNLSVGHNKMGKVLQAQGDFAGALREYRAALTIRTRLASSDPSDAELQWDVSASHNYLGMLLYEQDELAGALREFREALTIVESLAASDPSNLDWQKDLAAEHNNVGAVLLEQGNLAGALREFQEARPIVESLAASNPSNLDWQRELAGSHNNTGDVLLEQGNLAEALREFREALTIMQRLAASDPSNLDWQRDLAMSQYNVDRVLRAQRDSSK